MRGWGVFGIENFSDLKKSAILNGWKEFKNRKKRGEGLIKEYGHEGLMGEGKRLKTPCSRSRQDRMKGWMDIASTRMFMLQICASLVPRAIGLNVRKRYST